VHVTDPIDVVTGMLKATETLDVEGLLSYLADDVVYHNVPLPPARGIRSVEKQFRLMHRYYSGCEVHIHNIAANGSTVLTERTDVIRSGSWSAEFWVCGTFQLQDDRIVLWRDYFDMATFLASSVTGVGRVALAGARKLLGRNGIPVERVDRAPRR
jgi:limonene-1,2-epoxide hydrolase